MMRGLSDLPPIGTLGRYQVLGKLAQGGMAEIFLAREEGPRGTRRAVVLKRILPHVAADEEYVESFVQEASLNLRLRHPNICTLYEFGEDRGSYFLAMEFLHGIALDELVHRAGALPPAMAAHVIGAVAEGLAHAHSARDENGQPLGLVHRDVTPENIMIGFDGSVKLLDFGIAKSANQRKRTQDGILKGKIPYMSPEQYRGEPLDGRSDLFALGATFYLALTGESPFARDSDANTVAAILFAGAPSLADHPSVDVPPALRALVAGLLEKDRAKRPQDASQVAEELEAWRHDRGELLRRSGLGEYASAHFPERSDRLPRLERISLSSAPGPEDALAAAELEAELEDVVRATERTASRKRAVVGLLALLAVLGALGAVAHKLELAPEWIQLPW